MDWILTQNTRRKEDALLYSWSDARDDDNQPLAGKVALDIVDYYTGEGCLSPDAALLAALLINPRALADVRQIVTPEMLPRYNDADLFGAMLETPFAGELVEWWNVLSKKSGLSLPDIIIYTQYDYASAANCKVYADTILRTYIFERAEKVAAGLIGDLFDGNGGAIDVAINGLEELRAVTQPANKWKGRWTK
jgi:replicative DNA helicase